MRMRQAIDDLPFVSASRLRALGEITPEMKTATVRVGNVGFTVALSLFRWPNGGSWSFFSAIAADAREPCGSSRAIFDVGIAVRRAAFAIALSLFAPSGARPIIGHAFLRVSTATRRLVFVRGLAGSSTGGETSSLH